MWNWPELWHNDGELQKGGSEAEERAHLQQDASINESIHGNNEIIKLIHYLEKSIDEHGDAIIFTGTAGCHPSGPTS